MPTLFKKCRLIDGVSDRALDNALVVVDDDKVVYAGPYDEAIEAKYSGLESTVRNCGGMTAMPGLIDAHVHLSMYGDPSSVNAILYDSAGFTSIKASRMAERLLESGFTTVRSLGDKDGADFAVRKAVSEGLVNGPRVLCSGQALTITGGHGDFLPGDVPVESLGVICDGVDEVLKATRTQLKKGADNIKIMATGGGTSPGPATVAQFTVPEMRASVEMAEYYGKTTAAHCIGTEGIKNALRAGVRTIEHGTFLDDEAIEIMLAGEHYLVPTLCAFRTIEFGEAAGVPPHHLKKVQYYATAHMTNLQKAIRAKVKVICGTDIGTPFNHHGEGAEELERYTKNGMSPMQAIRAATSVAAEALRQDDIGVLAPGKTADLLLVEGDPLTDVALLQKKERIKLVMRSGRTVVARQ